MSSDKEYTAEDYNLSHDEVLQAINSYNGAQLRKLYIDDWVVRFSAWLTKAAIGVQRAVKRRGTPLPHDAWMDIKSELVIKAYNLVETWNGSVPLDAYLCLMLNKYRWSVKLIRGLIGDPLSSLNSKSRLNVKDYNSEAILKKIAISLGKSSLERANGIFYSMEKLSTFDKALVMLHFQVGIPQTHLDSMMGVSRGCTFHRLQRIMRELRDISE